MGGRRHRVGDGSHRRAREQDARRDVHREAARRQDGERDLRDLPSRRRDARKRVQSHRAEVLSGLRHRRDRESGAHLSQRERARTRRATRARCGDNVSARHGAVGLRRDHGLEHGGVPSGGVSLAAQGARQWREADSRGSALHANERELRHPRADPIGERHRVSRRSDQLRAVERALEHRSVLQELRIDVHQRVDDRVAGLSRHGGSRGRVLGAQAGEGGIGNGRSAARRRSTIRPAGSMRARACRRRGNSRRTLLEAGPRSSIRVRSRGRARDRVQAYR